MKFLNEISLKNKEGITLIALVISIIIMLILAGVSIGILTGDNGLLNKATQSREATIIAQEKEQIALAWNSLILDKVTGTIDKNIDENSFAIKFEEELNKNGRNIAVIFDSANNYYKVTFGDTGHIYSVDSNGKIDLIGNNGNVEIVETVSTEGKSAIFFGDSVAYGYSTNGNGFGYYINTTANFSRFTNAARNTATINTSTQGNNNIIEQMKNNKNNQYDFVIIEGGYGDLRDTPPLGNLTDGYNINEYNTTTFAGAVEYSLYLATTYWPNARIGFIISYDTPNSNHGVRPNHTETKKYWDIVKAACNKWNVQYLDFFEGSTNYNNEIKTYSELFDVTSNTYLASDNIHPTANGYEFICPFILDWMKTLKVYNKDFEINDYTDNNSQITQISQLSFYKHTSMGDNGKFVTNVTGRASCLNQELVVNGGETIGLSSAANNVTYAIYEFDENMNSSGGQTHGAWLSNDITLNSRTRFIRISFKNGNGSTDFSDEQLSLLPTYLEFKSSIQSVSLTLYKHTSMGDNGKFVTNVTGRASCLNQELAVNGGETIGLTSVANNVTYAIYEFDENMNPSGGQTHNAWLSNDITLNSRTRFIRISFKNGNGSTDFTDEQLSLLPTYIAFK